MAECSGNVVFNSVNTQKQIGVGQTKDLSDEKNPQKVMEPIFVDDSYDAVLPRTVLNVLSHLKTTYPEASLKDILVGFIYILMLENGFVPIEFKGQCANTFDFNLPQVLEHSKCLPKNWKKGSLHKLHFFLPGFDVHECVLACCDSAEDIVVNCVVHGIENRHFSICLDPLLYFSSSTNTVNNLSLQNLREFSKTVKSTIFYPAKQAILSHYDIFHGCLQALPSELVPFVIKYLPVEDFVHLGMTNKYFYTFLKMPSMWLQKIETDLNAEFNPGVNEYSYAQLVDMYKALKKKRKNHISSTGSRTLPRVYFVRPTFVNY